MSRSITAATDMISKKLGLHESRQKKLMAKTSYEKRTAKKGLRKAVPFYADKDLTSGQNYYTI